MGLVKNISIIGLVAVLSFYRTECQVTGFTGPTTSDAGAAGTVTTGITLSQLSTTAAVTIAEGTVTGTTIATILPTDGSGTETYAITTSPTIFAVASTGAITVSGTNVAALSSSPYTLAVTATSDTDSDATTGTITLTITVNALPVFSSGTRCWLIADATTATTMGTYAATDSGTVTYTISAGNGAGDFAMVSATGVLSSANTMDAATADSYTLTIAATDNGAHPAVATQTVFVSVEGTATSPQSCGTAGLLGSLLVVMAVLVAQFM